MLWTTTKYKLSRKKNNSLKKKGEKKTVMEKNIRGKKVKPTYTRNIFLLEQYSLLIKFLMPLFFNL